MLMVIFGAGASYDSFPSAPPAATSVFHDDRMPLATELFENRHNFAEVIDEFPECRPLIGPLRHCAPNEGVERVLERLQTQSENDSQGQKEITAIRYYLQKIIWQCERRWEMRHHGATNYSSLLYQIRNCSKPDEPVSFVTFNYDTMLEQAMPTLSRSIVNMRSYIDHRFSIFKVHGSVNWRRVLAWVPFSVREFDSEAVPQQVINATPLISKYLSDSEFIMVDELNANKIEQQQEEYALFPAIAIPVENKSHFELPPNQFEQLQKTLPMVTKLLVIGWRATDKPFLDLLSKFQGNKLSVSIVCENDEKAKEVRLNIHRASVKADYSTYGSGFTDFVTRNDVARILKI
jgi:hypothetical protein